MKKYFSFILLGCMISSIVISCKSRIQPDNESDATDSASVDMGQTVKKQSEVSLFDKWFNDFQESNPHWTRTVEGHKKLTKAFEKEMTSNLEFAKSVCLEKVFTSECISSYDRKDGEHGGIWSFVYRRDVTLKNPLYNGQTEVELAYEVFSTIPSTEPHEHPYLKNVNYSNTFNPYKDINYPGTLNLGSYIVTKKDN